MMVYGEDWRRSADRRMLRRKGAGLYEYGLNGARFGCVVNMGADWLVTDGLGNEIGRARLFRDAKAIALRYVVERTAR